MESKRISWRLAAPAGHIASVLVASGCAGAGGGGDTNNAGGSGKGSSINVLMVGNPQMEVAAAGDPAQPRERRGRRPIGCCGR